MKTPKRSVIVVAVLAIIFVVVIPLLRWGVQAWTDYLWYDDLGQAGVFVTRIVSEVSYAAIFGIVAFLVLYSNMLVARRMAPKAFLVALPTGLPPQFQDWLASVQSKIPPVLDKIVLAVAAWFAFVNGLAMGSKWQVFRIALAAPSYGMKDPQFGRDIGFFMFTLPALESITAWLTGILLLATVLALLVHLVDGAIQPSARFKGFAPHVKAHISVLLAAFALTRAADYWLKMWNLDFSPRGQVTGASYTDVHAQLPAFRILIVISLITAVVLLLNIRYKGWRLPIMAVGLWVAASILVGGIYPALVQQFRVEPNEAVLEAPYIERNIKMTREAFGLTDMKGREFKAADDLKPGVVQANKQTLSNIRLWDPQIVSQAYSQLQSIRSYYGFADVDVDRYTIDGQKRQVLVSARELDISLLDPKAQNWLNTHLVYTHGFGLVMSPVNDADTRGLPRFIIGDIPPKVTSSLATGAASILETKQPRIYFGEQTSNYAIVNTGKDEFDYPMGEQNAYFKYDAKHGPTIGSLPRRIAWAIRLGSSQILFSQYIKPDSRVLFDRSILARLDKLAPWLTFENDPYPVLVDGRITWVVDAYTHSNRFPYSEYLQNGPNYLRNSVKATVDAYTGETTLYAFDPRDPVLKAWSGVFPGLITDGDEIPQEIRAHFRYPEGFFSAQAEVYRTYHMTNVNVFYNKEDQWQIPGVSQGKPMAPYFVLLKLPGEPEEHFYLIQPYTPRNRDNMNGWIAASSDPDNYGQRTVYLLPKDRVVLGPEQVTARINQDPAISPQLSLWNQRGSSVLFGNMQVIPIEDSIVYIQPIFLQSEQTAIPSLTRVVVVYNDRVEMERTLEQALLKVFGQALPESSEGETVTPTPGAPAATAKEAQRLYDEAIAAQKAGNWAEYGRLIQELGKVLRQLSGTESGSAQ